MRAAGAAVAVSQKSSNRSAQPEGAILSSRFSLILSAILDSISFALFYLSFSALTQVLGALWCRLLAEV